MVEVTSFTTTSALERPGRLSGPAWRRCAATAAVWIGVGAAGLLRAGLPPVAETVDRAPRLAPDYRDLVIPPNIAPLNFAVQEAGSAYRVTLRGKAGVPVEISSSSATITIPEGAWRQLLAANRGGELWEDVFVLGEARGWRRFTAVTNRIAADPIDPVLIYRKIHPAHNTWSRMGIYQRNLETFDETPVLENRRFANDCCHCHLLRNNNPDTFTVDIRSAHYGNSLLVVSNGVAEAIRGTVGFVAWHPRGRVMACSISKPRLMLHTARNDMRDIAELEGWIGYFVLGSDVIRKIPGLADPQRLMAFPQWSPDGRYLYYCSAPNPWTNMATVTATSHTTARYDLMRVAYEADRDQWGRPEQVLAARETGFSVAQPRLSPDGRWIFFCAVPYGCWPTYDAQSDLYGVDLDVAKATGRFTWRKLPLNSSECESWLSWSSNSRWVVFSSKRLSPLFNRPYLAYVAPDGTCGKPFIVPQRDPRYYDSLLRTFTIPTLAVGPVTVPERRLVEAIEATDSRSLTLPGAKAGAVAEAQSNP